MENWGSAIITVVLAGFTFLTGVATLATKRNDSSSKMANKSFDAIYERLNIAEDKVTKLESVQTQYAMLKDDYDDLKKDYELLKAQNSTLAARVKELEEKERN